MASLAEFLSMPLSGGPNARPFGVDELGNTAFRGVLGPDYRVVQQAPNRESVVRGLLSQIMDAPGATLANLAKGAAQGTWDAISAPGRSWSDSTMTYGDVANTAGLVSLPAVAGKYDPAVANMGIRAYHGSPHDFDRFDMSKIGTGEGAQAYGHGLYFAEAEDVARQYRDDLSMGRSSPENTGKRVLDLYGGDEAKALDHVSRSMEDAYASGDMSGAKNSQAVKAAILDGRARRAAPDGRMYEVDINADPADFLDWDAPLSDQPSKVQELAGISPDDKLRLQSIIDEMEAMGQDRLPNNRMREEKRWFALARERDAVAEKVRAGKRGDFLYNYLADPSRSGKVGLVAEHQSRQRATDTMREAGIPGIKYYDQGSRAGKEGTRNYVVFDDSLIEILRKYGLAGAMLGFGAYPQENTQ